MISPSTILELLNQYKPLSVSVPSQLTDKPPSFNEALTDQAKTEYTRAIADRARSQATEGQNALEVRKALAGALQGVTNPQDAIAAAEKIFTQYGDVKSLEGIEKNKSDAAKSTREDQKAALSFVTDIAKYDPEAAQSIWKKFGFEDKYGTLPDFVKPDKAVQKVVPGVGLVDFTPGQSGYNVIVPSRDKPKSENLIQMVNQNDPKDVKAVNKSDANAFRQATEGGYVVKAPKQEDPIQKLLADSISQSQTTPDPVSSSNSPSPDAGGGILNEISNYLGGSSGQAPAPQAPPAQIPTPVQDNTVEDPLDPQTKGNRRIVIRKKGNGR